MGRVTTGRRRARRSLSLRLAETKQPLRTPGLILPFLTQQSIKASILNLTINLPALAQISLALKTEALDGFDRRGVARINVGFDAMQIKIFESVLQQCHQRFVHVTLAPMLAAEGVANLSPAMSEIQIEERDAADQLIICAQGYAPL